MYIDNTIVSRVKQLNPTVIIRLAKKSDAKYFVDLFNKHYNRKTNPSYFCWQYFDSPIPSAIFMAFDGDLLIGFLGAKIYNLNNNTKSGFVIDFLIDEIYRKRGISYLLGEELIKYCIKQGAQSITSLPNKFGNAAFKALGFESIAKIDSLVLKLEGNSYDLKFTSCNNDLNKTYLEFEKNEEYRKWRFELHPIYSYIKVNYNNCNALIKTFNDLNSGNIYCDIVDIQFDKISNLSIILKQILSSFKESIPTAITIWALPHTILYDYLLANGFVSIEQERYFCIKDLSFSEFDLSNILNWNLVEADAEIF